MGASTDEMFALLQSSDSAQNPSMSDMGIYQELQALLQPCAFSFSLIRSEEIEADDDRGGDDELPGRTGWRTPASAFLSNIGSKTSHHGISVPLLNLFNGIRFPDLVP